MPTAAHHRGRVIATVGAAGAHAYLAVLAAVDLLNYTVPTKYAVLTRIAGEDYWAWVHALCALLLVGVLAAPFRRIVVRTHRSEAPLVVIALNLSASFLATWGFFNMLWGLSAERPVSLAGPGLAMVVAAGEHLLANAWMRGTHNKGR
jgi:hypothetical protein